MPALASTDVTVAVLSKGIVGKKRRNYCSITFGDGALTYPTGGVPLPTCRYFGLIKQVDNLIIYDAAAAPLGYIYKYDKTNHKLMMFQTATLTPAGTVAAPVFTGTAATPAGTVAAPVFAGTAATPAGTVAAPTITTETGNPATAPIGVITGALAQTAGATGITGVQAPAFTGTEATPAGTNSAPALTGTPTTAAALAQIGAAVTPAAATLYVEAIGA